MQKEKIEKSWVVVRGAGDIATGVIYLLHQCGFNVVALECKNPSAIRRKVAFCEAVFEKEITIEGITCCLASSMLELDGIQKERKIPLIIDEYGEMIPILKPIVVVDAIIAKKNLGTSLKLSPITIALGPGFYAGKDVNAVIETMRGHNLGRIIYSGEALPNTGVPGSIVGVTRERVIYAPVSGIIRTKKQIGAFVEKGETLAIIGTTPVYASIAGVLRGIIRDSYLVDKGLKIADIDPRKEEQENCFTISDKARCIAAGVLEAIFVLQRKNQINEMEHLQ